MPGGGTIGHNRWSLYRTTHEDIDENPFLHDRRAHAGRRRIHGVRPPAGTRDFGGRAHPAGCRRRCNRRHARRSGVDVAVDGGSQERELRLLRPLGRAHAHRGIRGRGTQQRRPRWAQDCRGRAAGEGSCHTAEIGGYFVEGHVPAEDIKRLLAEQPDAKGLVLPGMPAGSPGMEMPDGRTQPYTVELVARDGTTAAFAHHGP